MTLPVRFFCSTQAEAGMAIHMGRPLTSKRMSMASAWRVAMATMLAFQRQCRSSLVQRSDTWKSSYMKSRVTLRRGVLQGKEGKRDKGTCRDTKRIQMDQLSAFPKGWAR